MIKGEIVELPSEAQEVLATWTLKTALMCQVMLPQAEPNPPAELFMDLYRDRRPAEEMKVFCGYMMPPQYLNGPSPLENCSVPARFARGGVLIGYPGLDEVVVGGRGLWRVTISVHASSGPCLEHRPARTPRAWSSTGTLSGSRSAHRPSHSCGIVSAGAPVPTAHCCRPLRPAPCPHLGPRRP
ncbi:hypothetical protein ADK86_35885 [Streptomyces sp. NRRL F-5755]|nr:hypothetical protein ADK86_35885 [Streptomyces sp. NRRL F-5755]